MENVKKKIYTVTVFLSILSNFLNWASANIDRNTNGYNDISYILVSNDKEGSTGLPRYIVRYVKDIDMNNNARKLANRVEPINFGKFQIVEVINQNGIRLSKCLLYRVEEFSKYMRRYNTYSYSFTVLRTCIN